MREFNFLKDIFIKKHKNIDNLEYLEKYINFLINYKISESVEYSEKHHILPRSTFSEFENESWNIIELDYENHKLVHLWLFKAINIRTYQRPLNWMMNYYKNSEETSNAAKKGWINLKNNKDKYNNWRKSRSDFMKNISNEEQKRRANIFWDNITDDEYINFCNKMKSYWTDDKKKEKSEQMLYFFSNLENVEKKRKETQDRWDSMDEEYRLNFKEKMDKINKDESKRIDAGIKIKKKWEDPDYLEKMKNRKKRNGLKIEIIKNNGDVEVFENMEDIVKKYKFSTHLIRKYRDSGNKITINHLNNKNFILLDSIIKTIKD